MMKNTNTLLNNEDGVISIEFAACFFIFTLLLFVIYDTYSSIALQNKLERVNYSTASVFRERSALYPVIDDTGSGALNYSICRKNGASCFKTHELFNDTQLDELKSLASSLMGKDVAVKVDTLYILQDKNNPADLSHAMQININGESCPASGCTSEIQTYFNSLPSIEMNNYTDLVPFVPRSITNGSNVTGRWIPLYRVSMCIINEESLYLKWINSSRQENGVLPNLCSNVVVLSRCNDIEYADKPCPVYLR